MSFVPPSDVVASPETLKDSDLNRPPSLKEMARSTNETPPTASPSSVSFATPPAGLQLHGNASEPYVPQTAAEHPPHHPIPHRSLTNNYPQIIPPTHESRTLVLCFDGTGDQFDQDNSNIVHFFQLLKKDDRNKQMVYYQAGIGTSSKYFVTPVGIAISKSIDMAVAHGLKDHVTDGYEFLMQNYIEGDKISLFGFSRGAYTARALAGMLHKVGLLPPFNYQQVPFAYHMYQRDDKEGWEMSNGFKQAFSIDVEINFMGLFDTVNSVGLIPKELPFAKSNYVVRTFRHAIALDERRAKFKANVWGRTSDEDAALAAPQREDYQSKKKREKLKRQAEEQKRASLYGYSASMVESMTGAVGSVTGAVGSVYGYAGSAVGTVASTVGSVVGYGNATTEQERLAARRRRTVEGSGIHVDEPAPSYEQLKATLAENSAKLEESKRKRKEQRKEQRRSSSEEWEVAHAIGGRHIERTETDVEEVWFAGAHTDVGGGSVKNGERYSLARISLRWMVRQCFKCDTGIMFHANMLEDIGISPESLWPEVKPRPPPIMSLADLHSTPPTPPLISHQSEPHLPAYSRLPTSSNDPNFNAAHPGTSDAAAMDPNDPRNPNAEKYTPYGKVTDLVHTQLSRKVDPYEPYIPFLHRRFGHELRDFGPEAREKREPFISEEVEDLKDALSPIYDQLSLNWWWWILEVIPVHQVWRKKDRSWRRFFSINFGGPRVIKNQKHQGVNVHRTVKIRMEADIGLNGEAFSYSPRAWLKKRWVRWLGGAE